MAFHIRTTSNDCVARLYQKANGSVTVDLSPYNQYRDNHSPIEGMEILLEKKSRKFYMNTRKKARDLVRRAMDYEPESVEEEPEVRPAHEVERVEGPQRVIHSRFLDVRGEGTLVQVYLEEEQEVGSAWQLFFDSFDEAKRYVQSQECQRPGYTSHQSGAMAENYRQVGRAVTPEQGRTMFRQFRDWAAR